MGWNMLNCDELPVSFFGATGSAAVHADRKEIGLICQSGTEAQIDALAAELEVFIERPAGVNLTPP